MRRIYSIRPGLFGFSYRFNRQFGGFIFGFGRLYETYIVTDISSAASNEQLTAREPAVFNSNLLSVAGRTATAKQVPFKT
ncbi:MAG: hypothetical protein GX827_08420 [Clostridiales bacterium]|nr:hypothetical protein [Clostridiales bacterium]